MPVQTNSYTSTTQQFLDIFDITSDLLIMKSGAASLIMTVDAMNFGLLAEEEQDAVIYAYAGLLNSLNFPIQIVIRSQTKDATNYLNLLRIQEEETTDRGKKALISRYRSFVSELIHERNVLDKKFYVVVTATALEMGLLPPSTVVPGVKQIDISTVDRSLILDKAKNLLEPRRDHLISQFSRLGLYARQLATQEIIQFFYTSYNPEAAEGQQITDTNSYTTPLVEARVQPAYATSSGAAVPTATTQPAAPDLNQPSAAVMAATQAANTGAQFEPVAPITVEPQPAPAPVPTPTPVPPPTPVVAPATPPSIGISPSNAPTVTGDTQPAPPPPGSDLPPLPEIK